MSSKQPDNLNTSRSTAIVAFLSLLLGSISGGLQGSGLSILSDPLGWLNELDRETAAGSLSDAAQLVANVVAIAITVVAIVGALLKLLIDLDQEIENDLQEHSVLGVNFSWLSPDRREFLKPLLDRITARSA